MVLTENNIRYFNKGNSENEKFWKRFSERPNFRHSSVLDVGCGHGKLCVDIALAGADKVVGVDINSERIKFAHENVKTNYPELSNVLDFHDIMLSHLSSEPKFDYILSKDSFEHIIELDKMLEEMYKRLKKGGRVYIGFSPLYNSYYGDHKRTKALLPWFHLIIPESILIWRLNRKRMEKINSIQELGLNKYSLKNYKNILGNSQFSIISFKVNCSDNLLLKLFTLIRKIPFLKEYFSHNIYCVLEK